MVYLKLILKVGTAVATVNTVANEHFVLLICSEDLKRRSSDFTESLKTDAFT